MNKSGIARLAMVFMLLCSNFLTVRAQQGADPININGQFVIAARAGNIQRVQALLQQGARVNSRDRNGDSPLNMAAAKGNVPLVDVLLQAEADVNLANIAGVTPLMGATFGGHAGLVKKLIAAKANVEPLDRVKKNAATYAAANGCSDCLNALLLAGVQVNARLENDLTLLMWAAAYGHDANVHLLLTQGADRAMKDARGKTATDLARDGNHGGIVTMLATP
jgi:ankyrin repeat protein